ncbi:ras GEF [Anaeromyces robustus]|jgi:hypothetical protein|uniref:Ras GEF n=1 Tax=Anaeromyces robustus TaxID=1754192 RepID=A0A1Y1WK85_9FUNG|nr:ras GEF [Anaeromyces robustus]|eukprot:ORX73514.1 ras GEF [Anaeromyces robustus]
MNTLVEAKEDYIAQGADQLSFKKGDIIQVITRLDSGWWDGFCNEKRGWFPSNLVRETYIEENQTVQWYPQLDAKGIQYYVNSRTNEISYEYPLIKTVNDSMSQSSGGIDNLPKNWGVKYTHDNRIYYYNKETDETCWSLDEINLETGRLKNKRNSTNSISSINEDIIVSTSPKEGELTWKKLANDIYYCLQQLLSSARLNKKESYISHSTAIVETIRTMLYASNAAKRDSPVLNGNKPLKQQYKHIMSSLSKLVVTTKTASQVWPPPDSVPMMQQAANEVYLSVKNFIHIAKELNIPLDIKLVEESNKDESKEEEDQDDSQQQNPTKIISQLEEYSKTISQSTQKLIKTVRTLEMVSTETIIAETKNIVIDVGNLLAVIDEIDYETLDEDIVKRFKYKRIAVCNSISGLVMATQNVVSTLLPSNFEEQILLSIELIENAVKDFVIATKCLLQEKENVDQLQYQRMFYDYNNHRYSTASSESSYKSMNLLNSASSNISNESAPLPSTNTINSAILSHKPRSMSLPGVGLEIPNGEYHHDYEESQNNRNRTYSQPQHSLPNNYIAVDNNYIYANTNIDNSPNVFTSPTPSLHNSNPSSASNVSSRKSSAQSSTPILPPPPQLYFDPTAAPVDIDQFRKQKSSNAKLMKVLGREFSSSDFHGNNAGNNSESSKKWYLRYDYDPKDLLFNMEGKVKGGTFDALVERLTLHDYYDANFTTTFLLTYRSFSSSTKLMAALLKRYSLPQPPGLTDLNEVNEWHEKKLKLIRLRVCNVVKSWFESYCIEKDPDDQRAFEMAKEFFERQIQSDPTFLTVSQLLDKFDKGFAKKIIPNPGREAPLPIFPKSLRNRIRFIDLDPTEIARQLTLMCSKYYNQIQPVECLNKAWSDKNNENTPAVNIKKMIEMSNQVSGWLALTILQEVDIRKRASILKHFIYVAEKCYNLNNFNTLVSLLAGFDSSPIYRLRRTWDLLSSKSINILENLKRIMDREKNYSAYREQLHSINPPCVPFLGVYLTDLTFIEDGNSDVIERKTEETDKNKTSNSNSSTPTTPTSPKKDEIINFSKQSKVADVIREIQQYQNQVYCLHSVPEIQKYLKDSLARTEEFLKMSERTDDESPLFEMSEILEPKEREDEKLTRLLFEYGFL